MWEDFWEWLWPTSCQVACEAAAGAVEGTAFPIDTASAAMQATPGIAKIAIHTNWKDRAQKIEDKFGAGTKDGAWGWNEYEAYKAGRLKEFYKDYRNAPPPGFEPLLPVKPDLPPSRPHGD